MHAVLGAGRQRGIHAVDGVMVAQGEELDPGLGGEAHHLLGRQDSIGVDGVGLEVEGGGRQGRDDGSRPRGIVTSVSETTSESLQLRIVFELGDEGWIVASIPEVPGALSQGRTREEARRNVIDALRLMLRPDPAEDTDPATGDTEPLDVTISA